MTKQFPSLPDEPDMASVMRRFPKGMRALCDYHDRILRDYSPLSVGQRELIAAYVSGLNACTYCHGAHALAAEAFGIDETLFSALLDDLDSAPVEAALKPLLAYVAKLTLSPARMTKADADAVYAAGWDEQALFDAISVCALFNFMNRIVEGVGMRSNPLAAPAEAREAHRARLSGQPGTAEDVHERGPLYSLLPDLWGLP